MAYDPIPTDHAMQIRACGLSWREIGELLAFLLERPAPYRPQAVVAACRRRYGREACLLQKST